MWGEAYYSSQRTREYAILKVDDGRLLNYCAGRFFKGLVGWIIVDIVIAILDRVELQDKSVTDAVLAK